MKPIITATELSEIFHQEKLSLNLTAHRYSQINPSLCEAF